MVRRIVGPVSKTRILILIALWWAVISFAAAVLPFVTENDVNGFFDGQRHALNRARLWHAATAIVLAALSVWALGRRRDQDRRD